MDALGELVFIRLPQVTTAPSYDRVRNAIQDWGMLVETPVERLTTLVQDAGLGGQRAARLKQIAARLVEDFGEVSFDEIVGYDDERPQEYLKSLPGVGLKTDNCVMMYSLWRLLLPVDTHTARVAIRLGLVADGNYLRRSRTGGRRRVGAPVRLPRQRRRAWPVGVPRAQTPL